MTFDPYYPAWGQLKHSVRHSLLLSLRKCTTLNLSSAGLTLLHSDRPKLYKILAFLSAKGLTYILLMNCIACPYKEEETEMGVTTRKKKKKAKHGYATRGGADNEDTATNRLTTRALYDTDEEDEVSS